MLPIESPLFVRYPRLCCRGVVCDEGVCGARGVDNMSKAVCVVSYTREELFTLGEVGLGMTPPSGRLSKRTHR